MIANARRGGLAVTEESEGGSFPTGVQRGFVRIHGPGRRHGRLNAGGHGFLCLPRGRASILGAQVSAQVSVRGTPPERGGRIEGLVTPQVPGASLFPSR